MSECIASLVSWAGTHNTTRYLVPSLDEDDEEEPVAAEPVADAAAATAVDEVAICCAKELVATSVADEVRAVEVGWTMELVE